MWLQWENTVGLDTVIGRWKWKPTSRTGIRIDSELENSPTLGMGRHHLWRKNAVISPHRTKHKRLSLCVNMEIEQCSPMVLRDTLIMNRKWERQSREEDFFLSFPLTNVCDNDTRTCFARKWKRYALVCLMEVKWRVVVCISSVQTSHRLWGFVHYIQSKTRLCCRSLWSLYVWCHWRNYFISHFDKRVGFVHPYPGICFYLNNLRYYYLKILSLTNISLTSLSWFKYINLTCPTAPSTLPLSNWLIHYTSLYSAGDAERRGELTPKNRNQKVPEWKNV